MTTDPIGQAARLIASADALHITAGAGMGVDSGLPDFRGSKGFWEAYPALARAGIDFRSIANPAAFKENPRLAWGFYGHRLSLYRNTVPHDGFRLLKLIAEKMPHGAFVSKFQTNIRPRFQREFFRWLGEREGEFAIRLQEIKRTDKEIEFGFAGLTSCLSVQVRPSELSVSVTRGGVFMDYLIDIDLMLERGALGYFCGFCNQAERDYFPTREEAWREHLFEPFLTWVNGQLASAQWLRIFRSGGGSSGASLIRDEADIEKPDSGMQLLARLKRLDGQPMFVSERDELEIWAIPLVCNERVAHFYARLSHV